MSIDCDFHFRRPDFVLSFRANLPSAGVTMITGKSGSGKTTLLRLMLGLAFAENATFIVNGQIYQQGGIFVKTEYRRIGYVGQDSSLLPFLSVAKNLRFAQKRAHLPKQPYAMKVPELDTLVKVFDIANCLTKYPNQLSSGQKQRVCIIQSILSCPQLFLFDEAFAAIDDNRKQQIIRYLLNYFDDTHLPVVYVSHDKQELALVAETTQHVPAVYELS